MEHLKSLDLDYNNYGLNIRPGARERPELKLGRQKILEVCLKKGAKQ